jgi:hypothetical protein
MSDEVEAMLDEDEPVVGDHPGAVAAFVAHYFERLKDAGKLFRSHHIKTALTLFDQVLASHTPP